jgi:hypothetical protein
MYLLILKLKYNKRCIQSRKSPNCSEVNKYQQAYTVSLDTMQEEINTFVTAAWINLLHRRPITIIQYLET